jgi:hypothetical protein
MQFFGHIDSIIIKLLLGAIAAFFRALSREPFLCIFFHVFGLEFTLKARNIIGFS